MIFEIVSSIILIVLFIILFINNRRIKKEGDALALSLLEMHIKNVENQKALEEMSNLAPVDSNDGFVKFLSQSREWAYEYIDNVQASFGEFDIEMSSQLTKDSLDSEDIEKLSMAYSALKQSIMPENDEMPNN
jgi:hypothetical protein